MTHHTDAERALASLRHLYQQMASGMVKDSAQARRIAEGLLSPAIAKLEQAARRAPAAPSTWKDHDTAKLVNDLRDCAVQYHAAGQLRERIAHLVRPLAARLACAQAAPVPQEPTSKQVVLGAGALLGQPENTADNRHPDWHSAVAKARSVYLAMLAAAPQPPEAGCSVSNGETQAAPVQLPEYGIDTANHAGIRVRGYTEQQVRELLNAAEAGNGK